MLIETLFQTLNAAKLTRCDLSFQLVNDKPTIVIQFGKAGASVSDSVAIQRIRQSLAMPLIVRCEADDVANIEYKLIEDIGHQTETLIDVIDEMSKQIPKEKSKAKPKSKEPTSNTKSSVTETQDTSTPVETVAPTQPSLSFDMSQFAL